MSVLKFEEYSYKISKDGLELQEWSYYKDHYPERYGFNKKDEFVYVIKYKEDKKLILQKDITESKISQIIEVLKKGPFL